MGDQPTTSNRWWGTFELAVGTGAHWQLGPFRLTVQRRTGEWRFATQNSGDRLAEALEVRAPNATDGGAELEGTVTRVAAAPKETTLHLQPALADRPMVIRTESPFRLPPDSEVTFHTSTPLWACVLAGKAKQPLLELPTWRPSDTWFGPTTTQGELCYAARTAGRLDPADLPLRPYRAATAVTVRNDAETALTIDRMLIPVEHLALLARGDGYLETQPVTLSRSSSAGATFEVKRVVDLKSGKKRRISEPRQPLIEHSMARALATLVS